MSIPTWLSFSLIAYPAFQWACIVSVRSLGTDLSHRLHQMGNLWIAEIDKLTEQTTADFQFTVYLHRLTTLAVHSALSWIPQVGVAGEFTTELRNTPSKCDTSHNGSFTLLILSALFEVEQHPSSFLFSYALILWAKLPKLKRSSLMQKTADRSNSHTSKIIQLPNITPSLPMAKSGNALVTELLPKSAYFCPLQIEQCYADLCIFSSLSVSLRQLLYFFIFID